jgi:hypothetical protein
MGTRRVFCLLIVVLASGIVVVPTACAKGHSFDAAEFPGYSASFRLDGSNGYSIEISAYSIPRKKRNGSSSRFLAKDPPPSTAPRCG